VARECPILATHIQYTQPFDCPLSGTTQVNQKKHSATLTPMRRRISTDNKVCFEPVRLLAPVKPAYNQSQPDSQLKLTASTTSQLWVGIPAVLVTVPAVMQNSLHPLSTSSITACCLLGKTTEADALTIRLDATPSIHILCQMPFLAQPSEFILAWDRLRMMMAWFQQNIVKYVKY